MVPPLLLFRSARQAIPGSAEAALWGELGGPWGKGECLTAGPGKEWHWWGCSLLEASSEKSDPLPLAPGKVAPTFSSRSFRFRATWV